MNAEKKEFAEKSQTIRRFALACAAVTSVFLIYLSYWLVQLLATGNWCSRAIGASEYVDGRPDYAVRGCFTLLHEQVHALANTLYISVGILALCLLVLMVIVVAGGRIQFSASKSGAQVNMGRDTSAKAQGAFEAAEAAEDKAEEIAEEDKPKPKRVKGEETEIFE